MKNMNFHIALYKVRPHSLALPFLLAVSVSLMAHAADNFQEIKSLDIYNAGDSGDGRDGKAEKIKAHLAGAKPGGALHVTFDNEFTTLFPYIYQKGNRVNQAPLLGDFVYQSLMEEDLSATRAQTLKPMLAEKVELDAEHKKIRVTLRDGVRFSDGESINADHVISSWKEYVSGYEHFEPLLYANFGRTVNVGKISERQVIFEMVDLQPELFRQAAFLLLGGVRIVKVPPSMTGDNGSDRSMIELPSERIGSGPYRIAKASRERVSLERNNNYWDPQRKLTPGEYNVDTIAYERYGDDLPRRFSVMGEKPASSYFRETNPGYTIWMTDHATDFSGRRTYYKPVDQELNFNFPTAVTMVLWFNASRDHLNNPIVRQALNLVWDHEDADRMLGDGTFAATSPGAHNRFRPQGAPSPAVANFLKTKGAADPLLSEMLKPYEETGYEMAAGIRGFRPRLKKAVELLESAGYELKRQDGQMALVKDEKPVELNIVYFADSFSKNMSKRIQTFAYFADKLGFKITIKQVPDLATRQHYFKENRYDLMLGYVELPDDFNALSVRLLRERLASYSGINTSRIKSPVIDAALEELNVTSPQSSAYPVLADAFFRAVSAHLPFITLGQAEKTTVYVRPGLRIIPVVPQDDLKTEDRTVKGAYFDSN